MGDKIRDVVAEVTGLPRDAPGDANLYLDLGVASVQALNLLTELETRFGVSIPDDEFVEATSITALTGLISNLLQERSAGEPNA